MDRGACGATVRRVAQSQVTEHRHTQCLLRLTSPLKKLKYPTVIPKLRLVGGGGCSWLFKKLIYLFTLIGGQLLYNIVMTFVMHQYESAISRHVSPPAWTPTCTSLLTLIPALGALHHTSDSLLLLLSRFSRVWLCAIVSLPPDFITVRTWYLLGAWKQSES